MGKKSEATETLSVRIPVSLRSKVDRHLLDEKERRQRKVTVQEWVNEAIVEHLKKRGA